MLELVSICPHGFDFLLCDLGTGFLQGLGLPALNPANVGFVVRGTARLVVVRLVLVFAGTAAVDVAVRTVAFAAAVAGHVVVLVLAKAGVDEDTDFLQELGPPAANPFNVGFVVWAAARHVVMWLGLVLTAAAAVDVAVRTVAFAAVVAG